MHVLVRIHICTCVFILYVSVCLGHQYIDGHVYVLMYAQWEVS